MLQNGDEWTDDDDQIMLHPLSVALVVRTRTSLCTYVSTCTAANSFARIIISVFGPLLAVGCRLGNWTTISITPRAVSRGRRCLTKGAPRARENLENPVTSYACVGKGKLT